MNLELDQLREVVLQSAQQAAAHAFHRAREVESDWPHSLTWLRTHQDWSDRENLLKLLLHSFETDQQFARSARRLLVSVQPNGIQSETVNDLQQAEKLFGDLAREVTRMLSRKKIEWEPSDPARLERGLQSAKEGNTVKADVAKTWFRRTQSVVHSP